MAELDVALVAADHSLWRGKASLVVATAPEGEIGIMPGHEPVLSTLVDGLVRVKATDGTVVVAAVHGGFFSVANNSVKILAETAELAQDIDVDRAKAALERITADGIIDETERAAELRARTRLKAVMGQTPR